MLNIELPEVPKDGHTIEFFTLNTHVWNASYSLRKIKLVYHKNTTWVDYCKSHQGCDDYGADIKDQWIFYESDVCTGRINKWKGVLQYNQKEFQFYFYTVEEAVQYELDQLEYTNEKYLKCINENKKMMNVLKELL